MEQRTITIRRILHTYKELNFTGISNMIKDNISTIVYLDEKNIGVLSKYDPIRIEIDSNSHTIRCGSYNTDLSIPSGTNSYDAYFFNNETCIGIVGDVFRDKLTQVVIEIFRGKGINDRIKDPNNKYNAIDFSVSNSGVALYWDVNKTKGIKQWATGIESEKLTFSQLGVVAPQESVLPSGYWRHMKMWLDDNILADESVNLEKNIGGFTIRSKHRLF